MNTRVNDTALKWDEERTDQRNSIKQCFVHKHWNTDQRSPVRNEDDFRTNYGQTNGLMSRRTHS